MIRKVSGKNKKSECVHIKSSNGNKCYSTKEISYTLGENFQKNSSSSNYSQQFQDTKVEKERENLNFQSQNNEKYNLPFKLSEFRNSLDKSNDTTAGPDDIHYQILKHLPSDALETLLNIMNEMWRTGKSPEDWHKAVIIPIPKPGKDKTESTNYRPIALTSCICKTKERMINEQGVPEGSILSHSLFNIKIKNIVKCVNATDSSLYVDDFGIFYKSKNMENIEFRLQRCLNKVETRATENGFKFSKTKTQCVHFCQLRGLHPDPVLNIYGSPIPVVEEAKFWVFCLIRNSVFVPHIKVLKEKGLKALDLLKVFSNTNWGGDRSVLLNLYRSLVR